MKGKTVKQGEAKALSKEAQLAAELYDAMLALKGVAGEIEDLQARHAEMAKVLREEMAALNERLAEAKETAEERADTLKLELVDSELPASYLVGEGSHVVIVEIEGKHKRTRIMPLKS